jgi:cell division protein FtsL
MSLDSQQDNAPLQKNPHNNTALSFQLFGNADNTQFVAPGQPAAEPLGSKISVVEAIDKFMSVLRKQSTTAQVDAALEIVKSNIDAITNVKHDGEFPDGYEQSQLGGKTFYDLLIAARDNYIKQLEAYNKVNALKESALEVTPYLHPKKNLARSIVSAVVGATVTGAVTYWLHKAFTDTIAGHDFIPGTPAVDFKAGVTGTPAVPGTPFVPGSIIEKDGTVTIIQSTPAVPAQPAVPDIPAVEARNATPDQPSTDATTEAPNGSEITLIVLVGIIMLAITAYIVYHYFTRYKEDEDVDPTSNKNLLNIDRIDLDKSQSQIKTQMNEVARADFNIKKRLQNPEQPSLIQAF